MTPSLCPWTNENAACSLGPTAPWTWTNIVILQRTQKDYFHPSQQRGGCYQASLYSYLMDKSWIEGLLLLRFLMLQFKSAPLGVLRTCFWAKGHDVSHSDVRVLLLLRSKQCCSVCVCVRSVYEVQSKQRIPRTGFQWHIMCTLYRVHCSVMVCISLVLPLPFFLLQQSTGGRVDKLIIESDADDEDVNVL